MSEDSFDRFIVCAGLQSNLVTQLVGVNPSPKMRNAPSPAATSFHAIADHVTDHHLRRAAT